MEKKKIIEPVSGILSKTLPDDLKVTSLKVNQPLKYSKKSCFVIPVTVTLSDEDNKREVLKIIVKNMINEDKDVRIQKSIVKEIEFYKLIIPDYFKVQKELNVSEESFLNLFPEYYGANDLLKTGQDNPTMFLIKDLRAEGYKTCYQWSYLNMDQTKLTIDKLAHFHAVGIALKENYPNIFEKSYKDILKPALLYDNDPKRNEKNLDFREKLKKMFNTNDKLQKYSEKVVQLIEEMDNVKLPEPKEPFATLTHNDLWKLNILLKYKNDRSSKNLIPIDVRFIDFQFCIYNSPIRDLVHFIYSSTLPEVLLDFKNLSQYYYENFIKYLKILKCNDEEFTIEKFNKELKNFGWTKIKHTIMISGITTRHNRKKALRRLYYVMLGFENNGWFK